MMDLSIIIDFLDGHIDDLFSSSFNPVEKALIETIKSIKYRWEFVDGGHKNNVLTYIAQTKDRESLELLRAYLKDCDWIIPDNSGL